MSDNTHKNTKVDQEACLGCGMCTNIAPNSFKMNDQGKSESINPTGDPEEDVQTSIDSCPVQCIKWED